jgi:type VI secretion system secreted protein VgrG
MARRISMLKVHSFGMAYMENIGMFMQTHVGMDQKLVVGKDERLVVGQEFFVHAKKIHMEADQEIVLTVGSSTIKITSGQIQILSPLDKLNC